MRKVSNSLGILASLSLLAALVAARPALAEDPASGAEGVRATLLETYDANGDGKLTGDEVEALRAGGGAQIREGREKKIGETDGDGLLFLEERRAAREREKKARLASWDTDGDGVISDAERAAGRERRQAIRQANFEKYDADGDGHLSPSERAEARKDGAELAAPGD